MVNTALPPVLTMKLELVLVPVLNVDELKNFINILALKMFMTPK
jgi:hypothetical protein